MEHLSMSDRKNPNLPFESSDASEQQMWAALGDLPASEPSANLRRSFYNDLEQASSHKWSERVRDWLGMSNNKGWLTAAASVLIGFGVAQLVNNTDSINTGSVEPTRLAALEESVALLNRELILGRLQDDSTGTRLSGVHDASFVVAEDAEIAQALLVRATTDRSLSVRSAAIDALGPQLKTDTVGNELMSLLESAESPLVQLALVDMVLRNGNNQQLEQLLSLANEERLHPDLIPHVKKSLGSEAI
jgi:hypothetical protein